MTSSIVYPNALKSNNLSFNIEISTPHASQANIGNTAKIAQVFAAVVASHYGVDRVDQLSAEQIADIELKYDHATNKYTIISQGAEKPADLKIRDAFKDAIDPADSAFTSTEWKKDPDLREWQGIKTIIELQTSASVSGNISASPSIGGALGTVASAAGKAIGAVGTVADYTIARPVKWIAKKLSREAVDDIFKKIPKQDRVTYFQEMDRFWENGTVPSDQAEKFYTRLIAAIKREKNVTTAEAIKTRFIELMEAIIGEENIPAELPDQLR